MGKAEFPAPNQSGMLSTDGDLLFSGQPDGRLVAYDADSLKELWSFSLGTPITAPPMTYSVGGKQYIAVVAGGANGPARRRPLPAVRHRGGVRPLTPDGGAVRLPRLDPAGAFESESLVVVSDPPATGCEQSFSHSKAFSKIEGISHGTRDTGTEDDRTKEGVGFPAGAHQPARPLCAWPDRPPRLPGWRAKVRRRRRDRDRALRDAQAELCLGGASADRRQADQGRDRDRAVPEGQRQHQGLPGAARQCDRQAAGGAGDPREPRPQPVYRGCGAAAGGRQLHRVRARWAHLAGRLSGRRGEGPRAVSRRSTPPRCARISSPRRNG